jgi:hypothetical protein
VAHPGQPGGSYRLIQADLLDTVVAGRPPEPDGYSHPDLLVNQRLIGWPGVRPRSIAQTVAILERAGIVRARVGVTVPEDGVYAVYHMDRMG